MKKTNNIKFANNLINKHQVFKFSSASKNSKCLQYILSQKELEKINIDDIQKVSSVDIADEQIINNQIVQEKLVKVAEQSTPTKKKKSNITSLILLIVNIVIVYFLASSLFKSAEDASLTNLIAVQGDKLYNLLYAFLVLVIVMLADSFLLSFILKISTGKFRLFTCYKASAIGKYYEAITPLSAGGQPAQILYFAKRKVSAGVSTSIPIIRVSVLNLMTILVAVVLFVFVVPSVTPPNDLMAILYGILKILAYIGVIFNSLYLIGMLIIANSKTFGRSMARSILKFCYKLKIVKDYRASYKKVMGQVVEYQNSIKYLTKNPLRFIISCLLVFIQIIATASLPFVICLALGNLQFATSSEFISFYLECLAKFYICYMASTYIPLPGGTGMMEISFVILFSSIIGSNFIVWGFLIWRIVSYYSLIVQGFIITIADAIGSAVKSKKTIKQT